MAMTETKALRWQCDASVCNMTSTVSEEEEPPGIRMTVRVLVRDDNGAVNTADLPVYACKPPHIRPAVDRVRTEADAELAATMPASEDDPADDVEGDDPADEPTPDLVGALRSADATANGVAGR